MVIGTGHSATFPMFAPSLITRPPAAPQVAPWVASHLRVSLISKNSCCSVYLHVPHIPDAAWPRPSTSNNWATKIRRLEWDMPKAAWKDATVLLLSARSHFHNITGNSLGQFWGGLTSFTVLEVARWAVPLMILMETNKKQKNRF